MGGDMTKTIITISTGVFVCILLLGFIGIFGQTSETLINETSTLKTYSAPDFSFQQLHRAVEQQPLLVTSGILLLAQTLLIVHLQRSRIRYKRARRDLKYSQKALEQRITDRTTRLRSINNQLYEEIARHEITEELLRETQDYLHSIINSMPSVLIGVTHLGFVTHWNNAATRATGINPKDALGKPLHEVYQNTAVNLAKVQEVIDKGTAETHESLSCGKNGETQYMDIAIYPLMSNEVCGAVIRVDDVTLRVHIENLMIQNEKMMSLGELAAGMAHEINNPLSAILHGVQNIYRRTSDELEKNHTVAQRENLTVTQIRHYLESRGIFKFLEGIRNAGERSANIVKSMLDFSHHSSRLHSPVDLVGLLEHSIELSTSMIKLDKQNNLLKPDIHCQFEKNIPWVVCSAPEIQQVILNLLRNAAQSFSQHNDLLSETAVCTQPTITVRAYQKSHWACIDIEDNGSGMSEAVKKHIFEPFFTTKDVGKGTGLGLSVSYFIVNDHHKGTIEVESSPGQGTRFTINLPLADIREPVEDNQQAELPLESASSTKVC